MREFLEQIWDHPDARFGELRVLPMGFQKWYSWPLGLDGLMKDAMDFDRVGGDVYMGVLPRVREGGTAEDCVTTTRILWFDLDAKHFGDKNKALFALTGATIEPSILVDSGNGYHAYYCLSECVPFDLARSVMRGMAAQIGGDTVADAPRILRLPSITRNHKTDPPKPVRLIRFEPDRKYRFSDFLDYGEIEPRDFDLAVHQRAIVPGDWEPSRADAPKFPDGSRNNMLTSLAGAMIAKGMGHDTLIDTLMAENELRCEPPLPEYEVVAIARSVQRYAR